MEGLERVERILALLEAHPDGVSGQGLAEACGVPWGTMKQDLQMLVNAIENPIPIYTDRDGENDEDEEALFQPDVKWFMAAAEKRYTPIHLNVREAMQVLHTLDLLEDESTLNKGLKQKILSGFNLDSDPTAYRYIKGELAPLQPIQGKTFPLIEKAILQNRRISIWYNNQAVIVDPLGLVYYSRLRRWYLVARQGNKIKTYYLNNIGEIKETLETFVYPEGFSLKGYFGPRWGMEYGEPLRVKVRFQNRAQTIAKVRKDVAHRESQLSIQEDGSLLFEDTIIGANEFVTWILGFGSAAEILEPVELRQLILGRVRETLANYQKRTEIIK